MANPAGLSRERTDPTGEAVREQLLARRDGLIGAAGPGLDGVVLEIDQALQRLERGTWGLCERCHATIESERVLTDPLVRVCLGCLDEREQRALERDLELAAAIQAALLPSRRVRAGVWEIAHRYVAAGPVSGDHCDVLFPEAPGGPVHFVLGDVAGKGVAAALQMTHLRAALRALIGMGLPLAELVARTNRLLCEGTMASSYATLVVGRLDPDGAVELCNAGHCPPILKSAAGIVALPATGVPIGLVAGASWEVRRLKLDPGDVLFAYTDGLSEAGQHDGGPVDGSWVLDVVRAPDRGEIEPLLDRCLAREAEIRGHRPRRDDLTLMAIRLQG